MLLRLLRIKHIVIGNFINRHASISAQIDHDMAAGGGTALIAMSIRRQYRRDNIRIIMQVVDTNLRRPGPVTVFIIMYYRGQRIAINLQAHHAPVMNPFTAYRTADGGFTALRFRRIDNIITGNLIHRYLQRVIRVDGDGFLHRVCRNPRRNRDIKRWMRLQFTRRHIHFVCQLPRHRRDSHDVPGVLHMIDGDNNIVSGLNVAGDQTSDSRGSFLRFIVVENVIARHFINGEMHGRLVRRCGASTCCRRGVHTIRSIGWNSDIA